MMAHLKSVPVSNLDMLCKQFWNNNANLDLMGMMKCLNMQLICIYSKTCVPRPPLGPEKSGRWKEVPDKTEILTGRWCIKLAVVNRWPLFTGGC
jgi:hypothetical protein